MDNKIWEIKEKEKICCFDIDGVLMNCYPNCWVDFINLKLKKSYADLNIAKKTVSYDIYRELKEQYRTSGIKEELPCDLYAGIVTKELKEQGWTIVIMTARPAEKYPTLAKQTYNWLSKNKNSYDYVIFGEKNKHVKILENFPNLKFAVEDNSYIANKIARTGVKVFLLENCYNKDASITDGVKRINSLMEILDG